MALNLLTHIVMSKNTFSKSELESQIIENLATAIIVFDDDRQVSYINQGAEILLAVSKKHVLVEDLKASMPMHYQMFNQLISNAAGMQSYTQRGVVLNNVSATVDCTVTSVIDDDGTCTIVELQQVDRPNRINREDRLISQQAVTRDLVRGLAHEIKNPLGGLRGAAQLLEAELSSNELKEYTQIIIEEADRLQQLVDRMIGPNRRPNNREVNIHVVLERVRSLILAEVAGRIQVRRDYDPSIPELIGDEAQLVQAVLNIVSNATKVLGENGCIVLKTRILRHFNIGSKRHKLVAQIDIIDDGPGIPAEIADTLFFPMVTKGTGGTGLGLSIAQNLINQHNGIVECHSKPGETVFSVLLPVAEGLVSHD